MSGSCGACRAAGQTPRSWPGRLPTVSYDPALGSIPQPVLAGHRLGARPLADDIRRFGAAVVADTLRLSEAEIAIICWWAGQWGPRFLRNHFQAWAALAGPHLAVGCINLPPFPEPLTP